MTLNVVRWLGTFHVNCTTFNETRLLRQSKREDEISAAGSEVFCEENCVAAYCARRTELSSNFGSPKYCTFIEAP
jgi:hypothetical protein